jgi:hypothetical protein
MADGRRRICKIERGVEKQEPPTEDQGLCGTRLSDYLLGDFLQERATLCSRGDLDNGSKRETTESATT